MNLRSPAALTGILALVVVLGFALGAAVAFTKRGAVQQTQVATTVQTLTPAPVHRSVPLVHIAAPSAERTPEAELVKAAATVPPAAPTPVPTPAATVSVAGGAQPGVWQISEANTQLGTIVWSGAGAVSHGNTLVLDLHKESIAGRSASPCERNTNLHAAVTIDASAQTVTYQEVNCQGTASEGEVRVSGFAGSGRSFSGSFWRDGVKLGNFDARKL